MTQPETAKTAETIATSYLVALEQLRLVHRNTPISQAMTLLVASLTTLALWPIEERSHLLIWLAIIFASACLRLELSRLFSKLDRAGTAIIINQWKHRTRLGTLLSGAIWGGGGVWLYPVDDPRRELFLCVIMLGMCSGAMPLQAPVSGAFPLYAGAILLPLSVLFILRTFAWSCINPII